MSQFGKQSRFFMGFRFYRKTATSETEIHAGIGFSSEDDGQEEIPHETRREVKGRQTLALPAPEVIRMDCRFCFGHGKFRGLTCPVCKGVREIIVPFDSVDCRTCYARGRARGRICPICKGSTRVSVRKFG